MDTVRAFLSGKKTYIASGLLVLVCAAELFDIDVVPGIDKSNALSVAWQAIIAIFIRAGIAKT